MAWLNSLESRHKFEPAQAQSVVRRRGCGHDIQWMGKPSIKAESGIQLHTLWRESRCKKREVLPRVALHSGLTTGRDVCRDLPVLLNYWNAHHITTTCMLVMCLRQGCHLGSPRRLLAEWQHTTMAAGAWPWPSSPCSPPPPPSP